MEPDFEIPFNCHEGYFNEVASIVFGLKENVIKEIITHPDNFSMWSFLTCFAAFFPLQVIAMGTAVPAGIFMPSILVGCVFGAFYGEVVKHMISIQSPGPYAMLGAVAMLGGIQRTTISLCVIMMEGTGQTSYILPIVLTTSEDLT